MNDLQIFSNVEFGNVRIVEKDGKPYAVGVDVARALDYVKPSQAVIDHCKGIRKLGIPSSGGIQETNVIPEGDIYRLIAKAADQSKNLGIKEKAEKFESWIFDEVLPTIRKHGAYMTPEKIEEVLLNPDTIINLATQLKQEQEKRKQLGITVQAQEKQISELKPKADYVDRILRSKSLLKISAIAKDYGMSGQAMNELLHELKIQYKSGTQWLLYAKYQASGYTHSETITFKRSDGRTDVNLITKWTQKGRLFLYETLKNNDVIPTIERDMEGRAI